MKNTIKTFWVEYNYVDGKAMNIKVFHSKDDAVKFANEVGGNIY